jgi:hypothetical protein
MKEKPKSELPHSQDVRLECIRIAYRHDRDAALVIQRALALEEYVLTGKQAALPAQDQ